MASHLHHYFNKIGIPIWSWSRSHSLFCQDPSESHLQFLLQNSQTVWLAVSDQAIEPVINKISPFSGPIFHLSGAHLSERAYDVHFLASFSHHIFDLNFYQKIPIITSHSQTQSLIQKYFPQISNPIYTILKEQKPFYHAACVLGGPGSLVLWWQMTDMLKSLGLTEEILSSYLQSLLQNWIHHKNQSVTGPWVRGDYETIEKHLTSLSSPVTLSLYQSLLKQYQHLNSERS